MNERNKWGPLAAGGAFILSLVVGIPLALLIADAMQYPAWPYGG
ncbi:hypothetical protein SEA_HANNABELLA_46 [Microbacterium phage Hannabella]|uniref:Uncharacterized protein n=1 Tax=Microbacterium phage Arete TaxID=2713257 RepID=A0A6G8R158_9CAUD|nr:hypothetical protein HWD16_gp46 [Microbacterium phage Arete]QIN93929.1 hypothetical protein SEA_ARETE_46 [Microbacterium phage Arete]URM86439.1 hypothetical protein SEA_GSHELBY23_44 [Microbacterium phage Gshelby23]UVG34252.1 hypothetical protein SEA_HANNABELLA_46 [Microbacterium phage Hannabella]